MLMAVWCVLNACCICVAYMQHAYYMQHAACMLAHITRILQVLIVLASVFYATMVANTMIFGETYRGDDNNPTFGNNPPRPFLEAILLQFQLLTGEGAQDVKNNAVFSDNLVFAMAQHGLFIWFNFGVSIVMIDLVVATFLEYKGIVDDEDHNNNYDDGDDHGDDSDGNNDNDNNRCQRR